MKFGKDWLRTYWDIIVLNFWKKIHFQHAAHQHLSLYSLYCMIKIRQYRCQMIHRSCTKQKKRSCDHFVMSRDQKKVKVVTHSFSPKNQVWHIFIGMDPRWTSLHWNSFGWPWLIFLGGRWWYCWVGRSYIPIRCQYKPPMFLAPFGHNLRLKFLLGVVSPKFGRKWWSYGVRDGPTE